MRRTTSIAAIAFVFAAIVGLTASDAKAQYYSHEVYSVGYGSPVVSYSASYVAPIPAPVAFPVPVAVPRPVVVARPVVPVPVVRPYPVYRPVFRPVVRPVVRALRPYPYLRLRY